MRFGCSGSDQAPHVSTTRPPNSTPGIGRATEPVARITAPASYAWPPTSTLPSAVSEASPSISSTLFLSHSIFTPLSSVSETLARRAPSAFQSMLTPSALIPSSEPFMAWS